MTLILPFLIRRMNWRFNAVLFSFAGAAGFTFITLLADPSLLASAFFLVGICGGVLFVTAVSAVTDFHEPAISTGWAVAWQLGLGAVVAVGFPLLIIPHWGFAGITSGYAVVFLCGAFAGFMMSDKGDKDANRAQGSQFNGTLCLLLLASLIYFTGSSGSWAFVERLGDSRGYAAEFIGVVLAFSLIAGGGAGLVVSLIGDGYGHIKPLLSLFFILLIALSLVYLIEDSRCYAIGMIAYQFSWAFMTTLKISMIASADPTGRVGPFIPAMMGMGGVLGPPLAGQLISDSFIPLYILLITTTLISVSIFSLAKKAQGDPSPRST